MVHPWKAGYIHILVHPHQGLNQEPSTSQSRAPAGQATKPSHGGAQSGLYPVPCPKSDSPVQSPQKIHGEATAGPELSCQDSDLNWQDSGQNTYTDFKPNL